MGNFSIALRILLKVTAIKPSSFKATNKFESGFDAALNYLAQVTMELKNQDRYVEGQVKSLGSLEDEVITLKASLTKFYPICV